MRLSACVMSKNGATRLPRLLSQLADVADEVVVGVDARSTDNTFDVARQWADRVYAFSFEGQTAPARRLVLDYATGDWILSVDDDELLEDGLADVAREIMATPDVTHAFLLRKWIVSLEPCRYVFDPGWYPDWQVRLFRNDPALVHKPSKIHTGYFVSGLGIQDTRKGLLHLEPMLLTPEERQRKLAGYRSLGAAEIQDSHFQIPADVETRAARLPAESSATPRGAAVVDREVRMLGADWRKGWGSEVVHVDAPSRARPGETMIVHVEVRNTGTLTWSPRCSGFPFLRLGNHLLDGEGQMIAHDRDRFDVRQLVPPGATATFTVHVGAPADPGNYVYEWDMMSEWECWFAELGATTLRAPLEVRA